jgi:hypothetical protein
MGRARGSKTPYELSIPLSPRTSTGLSLTCVFVRSTKLGDILRQVHWIRKCRPKSVIRTHARIASVKYVIQQMRGDYASRNSNKILLLLLKEEGYEFVEFNPLKSKLIQIIFKNSVRTAKKTQHFTITKINWLILFLGNNRCLH